MLPACSSAQPVEKEVQPDDFAAVLENIFKTAWAYQDDSVASYLRAQLEHGTANIPPFDMSELRSALRAMRCRKGSDDCGIVAEMVKQASDGYLRKLLNIFNEMRRTADIDPMWRLTLFSMLPKSGDLSLAQNWRPVAILRISYKLFARLVYQRLRRKLDTSQCADQVGFRAERSVDDAFVTVESIFAKSVEWNSPLWCLSLDLSKAFDRIEYQPLFVALREQGLCEDYIALLSSIYMDQRGQVKDSRTFDVQRGVKQGDVLSPLLFNAGLESALRKWKGRIAGCGLLIDAGERLTNIRYADDIMVFAATAEELIWMTEILKDELLKVGLQMNAAKTKVITSECADSPRFLDVAGEFVDVLSAADTHKYLGKKLSGRLQARGAVDLAHRVQVAWMRFHKHRDILLDKQLHIRLRLKFFQSLISPTILFGLSSCALSAGQIRKLDAVQRKMFRTIVGWVRHGHEQWQDTMRRMKQKVESALTLFPIADWSAQLARLQFRLVCRFSKRGDEWPMRASKWYPPATDARAHRNRGRPVVRWDDCLNRFVKQHLDVGTWQEACASRQMFGCEDEFVRFFASAE